MTTTDGYDATRYDEPYGTAEMQAVRSEAAAAQSASGERRISPADVHGVRFGRGTLVHPGYADAEVDSFLGRVADEIARLGAEKAELRDQVHALQERLAGTTAHEAPSDQAVRILAIAQQTADSYVAEAETFSRTATQQAREQYEEQLRRARENAGAIMQAAQEAAEAIATGGGGPAAGRSVSELGEEELQEQVRYLKAFAQAVRTQLRAYLEALLTDVETEWGHADPAGLPSAPIRTAAQRSDRSGSERVATASRLHADKEPNVADVVPVQDTTPGPRESGSRETGNNAQVAGLRR